MNRTNIFINMQSVFLVGQEYKNRSYKKEIFIKFGNSIICCLVLLNFEYRKYHNMMLGRPQAPYAEASKKHVV